MKTRWILAACFFTSTSTLSQDISRGQLLYETHCIVCHREGLHNRKDSKVATYTDLRYQVERWSKQAGRSFTPEEEADLVEFLDAAHYRLEVQPRPNKRIQ